MVGNRRVEMNLIYNLCYSKTFLSPIFFKRALPNKAESEVPEEITSSHRFTPN